MSNITITILKLYTILISTLRTAKIYQFSGGPHKWRDFMLPTQILDEFCVASGIPLPHYSSDGSSCFIG